MLTKEEITRECIEDIPYMKIRKLNGQFMIDGIKRCEQNINYYKTVNDPEGIVEQEVRKLWYIGNYEKHWGVCFGEGEEYKHFRTYKELLQYINDHH